MPKKTDTATKPAPKRRGRKAADPNPATPDQGPINQAPEQPAQQPLALPMTTLQPSAEAMAKLTEWAQAKEELVPYAVKVAAEMRLRKEAFQLIFPLPREGTNSAPLPHGWQVKGIHKLDYKLDETALPAVAQKLREHNVIVDSLIRARPELVKDVYRTLNQDQLAILSECLEIKPQAPALEVIPPKEPAA